MRLTRCLGDSFVQQPETLIADQKNDVKNHWRGIEAWSLSLISICF